MPTSNQVLIDHNSSQFYCYPCSRYFSTANGALSHCRTAAVHEDEWCERCERLFIDEAALDSHLASSSQHHIRVECVEDFYTVDDLNDHNASYHAPSRTHRRSSRRNNTVQMVQYSPGSHPFHMTESLQHRNTYQTQTVECFGCYEQFATRSGMLMHLESGACDSRVELHQIDEWAFRGRDSYTYTNAWKDYYKYRCPTCDVGFRVVSALIQHIEEQDCGQRITGSVRKMLDYLERKVLE